MDLDPAYPPSACADAWPFDSLTTSLLFSPQLTPIPANSSFSWLTPHSPLWLFEDRHLLPLDAPAVFEEVQRPRSGEPSFSFLFLSFPFLSQYLTSPSHLPLSPPTHEYTIWKKVESRTLGSN
jgi:hypothetical protein